MRLARTSHDQLERFFRQHFGDETLKLPRVEIYAGLFAACLTKVLKVSAVTIGQRVFVSPEIFTREDDGKRRAPARLIAHEATHVLQYKSAGYVRFLSRYLYEYVVALRGLRGRITARHRAAYRAISFEQQARAVEEAFARRA